MSSVNPIGTECVSVLRSHRAMLASWVCPENWLLEAAKVLEDYDAQEQKRLQGTDDWARRAGLCGARWLRLACSREIYPVQKTDLTYRWSHRHWVCRPGSLKILFPRVVSSSCLLDAYCGLLRCVCDLPLNDQAAIRAQWWVHDIRRQPGLVRDSYEATAR